MSIQSGDAYSLNNEIIYQCLVPLGAIIVPLIVVYLQNKESELRKESEVKTGRFTKDITKE